MNNIFENYSEKNLKTRLENGKKTEKELVKMIEKSSLWKLKKSSAQEDKEGIDYWGRYNGGEEVSIQLKHRADGSGNDFLMELSKNWVGEKTVFDGKETKKADVYFFVTKQFELYLFDGKTVQKRSKKAFRCFYNNFLKTKRTSPMSGNLDGMVIVTKKRTDEDSNKKSEFYSDKKLLYFCDPDKMKKYKDFHKIKLI